MQAPQILHPWEGPVEITDNAYVVRNKTGDGSAVLIGLTFKSDGNVGSKSSEVTPLYILGLKDCGENSA